jgi:hypothetical protein
MNLLEFRSFLNTLPEEDINVNMTAGKIYDLGDDIEVRLDMPFIDFFIDVKNKEAVFVVKSDQEGLNQAIELMEKNNIQPKSINTVS